MGIISKIKKFIGINEVRQGSFYPFLNSSYSDNHLGQSDYIRLYTGWAYVAISTIANTIAGLEWSVTKNADSNNELNHKHRPLITASLLNQIVSYLQISGTCYLYKSMMGKTIDELWVLRTDLVQSFEGPNGVVQHYDYHAGGKVYRFYPDELIDISLFTPYGGYPYTKKGVSPMQAVAMQLEVDQASTKWNWNIFRNGASVSQILKSPNNVDAEVKKKAIQDWKNNYGGVNNAHKMAFLDGGTELQIIQANKRELDFVEGRRFTRDEIFEIFKVPKAILGNYDNTGNNSSKEATNSYFSICIQPICRLIEEQFNKELFPDANFRFVNYIPTDTQQLYNDFISGAITVNEYRKERGYDAIKGGDTIENDPQQNKYDNIIAKSFRSKVKGTKEYEDEREEKNQEIREKKIARLDEKERKMTNAINAIFEEQKKDTILNYNKKSRFSELKYKTMRSTLVTPIISDIYASEGQQAMRQAGLNQLFRVGENDIQDEISKSVSLMQETVDKTTLDKLTKVITDGNDAGLGVSAITDMITNTFNEMKASRAETIARTEITRASNNASIKAWEQSGVVNAKERYTARDERVCPQCGPMQGKVIGLKEDYFKKGDTWQGMKLDYTDTKGAPLHVSCRCTLLPVID